MLLILCVVLAFLSPAGAETPGSRAVLVLVPGVSGERFLQTVRAPEWNSLLSQSSVALMSAAVPGSDTLASAYLTLGAGRRVEVPRRSTEPYPEAVDLLFREPMQQGLRVTLLSPRGSESYARLIGSDFASNSLLPADATDQLEVARQLMRVNQLLLIETDTLEDALRLVNGLTDTLNRNGDLLVLTSLDPDNAPGGQFRHLAPALFWGAAWRGNSAVSATTRTPGLISNSDLVPTLLEHLGLDLPRTIEGHAVRPAGGSIAALAAFEKHVRATGEVTVPVLIGWGTYAFFAVALVLYWLRSSSTRPQLARGRRLLAAAAAFPLAMLLAAGISASSAAQLVAQLLFFQALLVIGSRWAARKLPPLLTILSLTSVVILIDLLLGGWLLRRCLLGDFVNTGVRFYGIGNEYEGLVLGASVLLPFWLQQVRKPATASFTRFGWVTALLWPATFIAVAAPGLGADFGGALSLGLAYAVGAWLATGRRLHWQQLAVGGVLLFVLALGVIGLDLMRPVGSRSHVGELAAQLLQGDTGRVGEVIGRKLLMNVRMVLTPYALVGLAAVAALGGICYHRVASRVREAVRRRPLLRAGSGAALLGAAAAFALNDSGIVAGAIAAGCVLLMWLDALLSDALERELV